MSSDWINRAKEAAKQVADEAKKLAETAKNTNYSELMDKTKGMATQAAEEAKKAAGSIMQKTTPATPEIIPQPDNQQGSEHMQMVEAKIEQVERLLHEIKGLLKDENKT